MIALFVALALAAPPEDARQPAVQKQAPVTLKYRFQKGLALVDRTSAAFTLDMFVKGQLIQFDIENRQELKRTVVKADESGAPLIERVEVKKFIHTVRKHPKEQAGDKYYPSHGHTYVWRKKSKGDAWGLYGDKGEVTKKHPQLVAKLKNWRAARLPKEPVAIGGTWEVSAARFLRAVGQPVPKGVVGKATFRLVELKRGVARITFVFKSTYRDGDSVLEGSNKGEWRFDVARGRDLSLHMKGVVEIDKGDGGAGRFKMTREVTYGDASRTRGGS